MLGLLGFWTTVQDSFNSTLSIPWRQRQTMQVDIVGEYNDTPVVIEYDGWYWHSGQRKNDAATPLLRDIEKTQAMLETGYIVIRLRERTKHRTLPSLPLTHDRFFQLNWNASQESIQDGLNKVYDWLSGLEL